MVGKVLSVFIVWWEGVVTFSHLSIYVVHFFLLNIALHNILAMHAHSTPHSLCHLSFNVHHRAYSQMVAVQINIYTNKSQKIATCECA